jgi:hypothetical protein
MSYAEPEASWPKRIATAGAALVFIIIAGAIGRGVTSELFEPSQKSPTEINKTIETALEEHETFSPFFLTLKAEFPDAHRDVMEIISDSVQSGVDSDQAYAAAFNLSRNLIEEQGSNIRRAPRKEIFAIRDTNLRATQEISKVSPMLCARFTMDGLRPTDRLPQSLHPPVFENATAMLKAAAAGRDRPVPIVEPTSDDWIGLTNSMQGLSDSEFQHWFDGTHERLAYDRQCQIGLSMMTALTEMESGSSERIMRALFDPDLQ